MRADDLVGRKMSYEEAKELARTGDASQRRSLAARPDLKPELLYFLAEDSEPVVRRAAAANRALPRQADLMLAGDADQEVREGLADKIAKLAPGLTANEQDKLQRQTYEVLETLARDQATRVRQILSEALKDIADAPPEVIRRLARDAELVVSGPVLEFSPVLSDEDLVEIIVTNPVKGALGAISRRAFVSERVSEAVVASDDVDAIAELLGNRSAQIREETLDRVIDRAVDIERWHMPLVQRPTLSTRCAQKVARYVASNLLDILDKRHDLDPDALAAVRAVVEKRLAEADDLGSDAMPRKTKEGPGVFDIEDVESKVATLMQEGKLDHSMVSDALKRNDRHFVRAALTELSGVARGVVEKAFLTHSAKGIVAVCWKAGLDPDTALVVQQRLGGLAPRDILEPEEAGTWPLSPADMEWQLEFLNDLAR
ncbi:MAG: DUF2336 domain-containing protein [Magnetospirillum sp. WYHS-4]